MLICPYCHKSTTSPGGFEFIYIGRPFAITAGIVLLFSVVLYDFMFDNCSCLFFDFIFSQKLAAIFAWSSYQIG